MPVTCQETFVPGSPPAIWKPLSPRRRGRQPTVPDPRDKENAELKRALAKAEARAKRAEALVEVQKKVSELLGIQLPQPEEP